MKTHLSLVIIAIICRLSLGSSLDCLVTDTPFTEACLSQINMKEVPNAQLAFALGESSLTQSHYSLAMNFFRLAIDLDQTLQLAYYRLILCLFHLRQFVLAVELEYSSIKLFGLSHDKYMTEVLDKFGVHNFEKYIQEHDVSGSAEPALVEKQAVAYYFSSQFDKSLRLLTQCVRAHRKDPQISVFHYMYIRVLEKQKNYFAALESVSSFVKQYSSDFYLHHLKGNQLMHHLKFSEAKIEFDNALRLSPTFQLSLYNKAICCQSLNQMEESATILSKLQSLVKGQAELLKVYNSLGFAYQRTGHPEQSERIYKQGLAIETGDKNDIALLNYNLGTLFYGQGRYQQAYGYIVEAVELAPNLEAPKLVKGLTLFELSQSDQAIQVLEQLHQNPEAQYHLAVIYLKLQKLEKGLEAVERSLLLNSDSAVGYNAKGLILYDLKRYKQALQAFKQASQLEPEDAQNYFNLALCLLQLNRADQAMAQLRRAQQLGSVQAAQILDYYLTQETTKKDDASSSDNQL